MSPIGLVCMDMPDDCTARLVDAAGSEVDALNTGETSIDRDWLTLVIVWVALRIGNARRLRRPPVGLWCASGAEVGALNTGELGSQSDVARRRVGLRMPGVHGNMFESNTNS